MCLPTRGAAAFLLASGCGVWFLLQRLGRVRIGLTRTLGLAVDGEEPQGHGRRLGLLERWYTAHSRRGNHTGLTLAVEFRLVAPPDAPHDPHARKKPQGLSRPPTMEELHSILHRVALRMPMLRARMHRDGVTGVDATARLVPPTRLAPENKQPPATGTEAGGLWGDDIYLWVPPHDDGTRDYVHIEERCIQGDDRVGEARGLRAVLEEQNSISWHDEDPSRPLWRVVLVRWKESPAAKFALVLSFHHAITDGMGATAVVQAIMEESVRQDNPPPDEEILCRQIPPPMEDILDTVPRLHHMWRPVLLDRLPLLAPLLAPRAFSGRPKKKMVRPFHDSIVCLALCPDAQVQRLRRQCRERHVTLHAALVAALCKAVAIHVQAHPADFQGSSGKSVLDASLLFRVNSPVNERKQCRPPSALAELCCRISATDLFLRVGPRSKLATVDQKFMANLQQARVEAPMIIGLTAFISGDWLTFSDRRLEHNGGDALETIDASNLGVVSCEWPPQATWKVQDFWLVHGRQNPAPALKACWVTTQGGNLNLTLSSLPQHFTREDLLSIAAHYQVLLKKEYCT
jgi:hypothetical protein